MRARTAGPLTERERALVVHALCAIASDRFASKGSDTCDFFPRGSKLEQIASAAFMAVPTHNDVEHFGADWAEAASWVASGWEQPGDEEYFQ